MAATRIRIDLLGPVAVTVDGAPLNVDTRKAVALLAWLAMTRRPAARETLAGFLWPEADGADAKGALRRTLSVLRAGLGDTGLMIDRASVGLREAEVDVDAWRFSAALTAVRGHAHAAAGLPCAACLAHLETAAALDRGGFMAGFTLRDAEPFDEWQTAETEAYRRDLASVLERLARGHLAAGSWEASTTAARRWLALDPLHEPAHRTLMETLARAGEPAAAIAQYRACIRILDRELGVAPLAQTSELADAIRAGSVGAPVSASQPAPASLRSSPRHPARPSQAPLVGREAELTELAAAYEQVGATGRLIAVTGEPGIGKTRLLAAAAELVRGRGGAVLAARAWAGESTIAFSIVAELVRAALRLDGASEWIASMDLEQRRDLARLVPLPGAAAPPPEPAGTVPAGGDPFGRIRLFGTLLGLLDQAAASGSAPGALVIDDLHLADPASLELIAYLARRLPDHPLALVLAWRAGDPGAGAAEPALDAARSLGLATELPLGRLTPEATAQLGRLLGPAHPGLSAAVAESEGLPLYLVEAMATSTTDAVPGGVQVLLRARTAAASEIARQVLAAAAVIGRSFEPALVRAASGRSEDETVAAIDELIGRGIVGETAGSDSGAGLRIEFSHGRLRDVVYDDLSLVRRRLLHGRVADALRESPGRSDPVTGWSLIARHEALAGRTAAAADAHAKAGDGARSMFANAVAREHLEAALALGHPDAVALHDALGDVLMLLGDYEGARMHLETAAALAGPAAQAALEHRIGLLHVRRGDWLRADGHLVAALAADPAPGLRSRILADRAAIADRSGDPAEAAARAAEALALALDAGDVVGVVRARGLMGILARHAGDLVAARRALETALAELAAAEATHGAGPEAWSVRVALENSLALTLSDLGDRDAALVHATAALARCERLGDRHHQAALENNLADLLHAAGRPDEAMAHLTRAVTLFAEIGGRPGELEPEIWKLVEW